MDAVVESMGFPDVMTFRETVRGRYRWYAYSIPELIIPAASARQQTIRFESGSDFYAVQITGRYLRDDGGNAGNRALPTVTAQPDIRFEDAASSIHLEDRDMRFENVVGFARFAQKLETPYLFRQSTNAVVVITNPAAIQIRVIVTFGGYKIFW